MFNDDVVRLRHMLDAAREAVGFAQSESRKALNSNRMLVLSLVKDIEIIGEAANQVSESMRHELDNIPWDDIIGMRHRLVHAYFDINLDILWRTVQNDLPALIVILESVIPEEAS
ncbi:HepT-like ribonuclease domain-containing protein [uncultured Desulfobulbus sp.]|uniref:HepT-like ribonuclease domain-containing protein n=1 Tax=uncultured Desulfobulbus sp. TaxID=239745 RepID=UPI0029C8BFF1|nr:HepT-like ribonuclease domain-containing protein [uncultured Desulfobulbus sp.]